MGLFVYFYFFFGGGVNRPDIYISLLRFKQALNNSLNYNSPFQYFCPPGAALGKIEGVLLQ